MLPIAVDGLHHGHWYPPRRTRRAGVALPLVLACIVVAMMLCAAMTRTVLLHHRQLQVAIDQQQTEWLAESGVQRAIHGLRKSPDYRGERWPVPATLLSGGADASVTISVQPQGDSDSGWNIVVESRYPDRGVAQIVCQRELYVASSSISATPPEESEESGL